jgi:hypothetical protein
MAVPLRTSNDITTQAGLIAEFDRQYNRLRRLYGWCGSGRRTAWEIAGIDPATDWSTYNDPYDSIGEQYLSEEGLARKAGAAAREMEALRRGILSAARYSLASSHADGHELARSLTVLGLGEYVQVQDGYRLEIIVQGRTAQAGEMTDARKADLTRAVSDALAAMSVTVSGDLAVITDSVPDTTVLITTPEPAQG